MYKIVRIAAPRKMFRKRESDILSVLRNGSDSMVVGGEEEEEEEEKGWFQEEKWLVLFTNFLPRQHDVDKKKKKGGLKKLLWIITKSKNFLFVFVGKRGKGKKERKQDLCFVKSFFFSFFKYPQNVQKDSQKEKQKKYDNKKLFFSPFLLSPFSFLLSPFFYPPPQKKSPFFYL